MMTSLLNRFWGISWEKGLFYSLLSLLVSLSFSTALIEISFVAALFFAAGLVFINRKNPFEQLSPLYTVPLGLYVVTVLLSVFWTDYPKETFRGIFKVLQQVCIFFLVAQLPRTLTSDNRLFEKVFLVLLAAVVANGLFQYAFGVDFVRGFHSVDASSGPRVTSSFKSYGLFASFLVVAMPLVIAYAGTAPRFSRYQILLVILVIEGLLCLFLTRSRGAWLAFFAGSFLVMLAFRQWRFATVLTLAAVVGLLMLPRNILIHLDSEQKEQSIVERLDLWKRAADVIEAKPWTGTGINTYTKAHVKYDKSKSWRVRDYYAHNGYLQMAAEIGLPGAFAFLTFLTSLIILACKRSTGLAGREFFLRIGLITGVTVFSINAAWDTLFHNPQAVMTFWFFLGLIASAIKAQPAKITP